jgi:hypothetical protein
MIKDTHEGLNAIQLVQSKLDKSSHLEVISERANCWNAYFSFEPPAKMENLERVKARWQLPQTYEQFLIHYDGALLYNDDNYGQWGFKLYGTSELIEKNALWQSLYEDGWSPFFLVFAETLGDADLLLLDTKLQADPTAESYVLDGDTGYPVSTWYPIARSFGEWLDHLVVAQGAKYWRWYPPK